MRDRGVTLATILAGFAAAAFAVGNVILGASLTVLATALALASVADRLPLLNRLPVIGAAPLPDVEFYFEDTGRRTFVMHHEPQDAILAVGITNHHHYPIKDVVVNAYLVGSTDIERCTQDGEPYGNGGRRARGPDAPYWSQVGVTIQRDANPWYFRITIPRPGGYLAVLVIDSPDFYGQRDVRYEAEVRAVKPE